MAVVRPIPEIKYELLSDSSDNPSLAPIPPLRYRGLTAVFVCVVVLLSITVFTLHMLKANFEGRYKKYNDNLDYEMYGPFKSQDFPGIQQHRAELYAKANQDGSSVGSQEPVNSVSEAELLHNNVYARVTPQPDGFRLVCYYALPAKPELDSSKDLMPENINASLCTHINLAFAGVSNNSLVPHSHHDLKMYERVIGLKSKNPNLKVLLSVNSDMSAVVLNHTTRKAFIRSCIETLKQHKLDGLDLDWEFPNDAWRFMTLLEEIREAFGHQYLLSVAVAAPQPIVDVSYKINVMARFVDWVNLMSYDFHHFTRYYPVTGLNAPLYASQKDQGYFSQLNTNWSVNYWESQGMPRSKIVVGVPTYGHTFGLVNADNTEIGAPASGFGSLGGSGGFIDYPDVCQFILSGATVVPDRATRVPYAVKGYDWVSYDSERSIAYKAEYVTNHGYGGVMIWSLNADDHQGLCSEMRVKFPLTTRIKNVLTDDQL